MSDSIEKIGNIARLSKTKVSIWDILKKFEKNSPEKFWSMVIISITIASLVLSWLILYWFRPLMLLSLAKYIKLPETIEIKGLALRSNRLADLLIYRPRVLDTWVSKNLEDKKAESAFKRLDTVRVRHIHIPLPVDLDGTNITDLTPNQLRPAFTRKRSLLLVYGEGGSGKTSIACQIALLAMTSESLAAHPMLPVLLEHDVDFTEGDTVHPLCRTVQGILSRVYDLENDVPIELVDRLMYRRRLLVIVDHLSEMNKATQDIINPTDSNFPANALIVTSRQQETLSSAPLFRVKTKRIAGNYVSEFLEAYLQNLKRRQDFDDSRFFDACAELTRIVGDRDITVLLAKMYADQLVMASDNLDVDGMATNLPDLMLNYVAELNRNRTDTDPSNIEIIADIKIIAWMCLKKTGRARPVARADILDAIGPDEGEARLKYIQKKLLLLHAPDPSELQLTFVLHPVAEYFAAMSLFGDPDSDHQYAGVTAFLDDLPSPADKIEGFLLSIRDCSNVLLQDAQVTSKLERKITNLIQFAKKERRSE